MPFANQPPQSKTEKPKKKPNNFIWWFFIVILLGPAAYLTYSIVSQPPGNQTFFNMNRPDTGAAFDIQYAEIIEQELNLTVSYQGGCGDHMFDLYIEDQKSDINRALEVHHQSDDTCDTRVTEDLKYDLSEPINEHDSEQIVFTIAGNGKEPEPILFKKPPPEDDLTP